MSPVSRRHFSSGPKARGSKGTGTGNRSKPHRLCDTDCHGRTPPPSPLQILTHPQPSPPLGLVVCRQAALRQGAGDPGPRPVPCLPQRGSSHQGGDGGVLHGREHPHPGDIRDE